MEKAKEDIYQLRKLQVLPYSLNSVINHDCRFSDGIRRVASHFRDRRCNYPDLLAGVAVGPQLGR